MEISKEGLIKALMVGVEDGELIEIGEVECKVINRFKRRI